LENKKKILFVINPTSGIGRQMLVEKKIRRRLDMTKFDYEVTYTEYAHHGVKIAREASGKGVDLVVSVGGDGSANDVAQALVNTDTAMGIIPVGSGNGLGHYLKIPSRIASAIKVLNRFEVKKIDTVTMNGKLFASIAGLGFDALVAEKFAKSKLRGFISYAKIMFREYMLYKSWEYTLAFDGKEIKRRATMISFANSDQYGYNARISPKASIDDGYVDLCIIHRMTIAMALFVIPRLFFRNAHKSKFVEIYKVKEAVIKCEQPDSSHIDGDADERITEAIIKVKPLSLNVVVP
jgi:diacylglycerol kinase (ATP)